MATSRSRQQKCKQTAQSSRSICQWIWTAKHRATVHASLSSAAAGSEGQTETCQSLKSFSRKTVFKTVIRIPLWIPCLLQICAPVEIREFPPTAGRAAPTLHFRSCPRFFQTHPKATHNASDALGAINSHNSRAASSPASLRPFTGKVSRKSPCGKKQDSTLTHARAHTHTHTHTHTLCICSQTLDWLLLETQDTTALLHCTGQKSFRWLFPWKGKTLHRITDQEHFLSPWPNQRVRNSVVQALTSLKWTWILSRPLQSHFKSITPLFPARHRRHSESEQTDTYNWVPGSG